MIVICKIVYCGIFLFFSIYIYISDTKTNYTIHTFSDVLWSISSDENLINMSPYFYAFVVTTCSTLTI